MDLGEREVEKGLGGGKGAQLWGLLRLLGKYVQWRGTAKERSPCVVASASCEGVACAGTASDWCRGEKEGGGAVYDT